MQDGSESNQGGNEAKQPPGRTPAAGTDSGDAQVPGGGTGNRGAAGIGTAGGNGNAPKEDASGKRTDGGGGANDLDQAGDYSR